jgi:hypothetical protein
MGIIQSIKKSVLTAGINKRKAANPFDVDYSDHFVLPLDADGNQNNSHYFSVHDLGSKECFYFRLGLRGAGVPNEVWLVYRDKDGVVYINEKDHVEKTLESPAKVECIEAGKVMAFSFNGKLRRGKLNAASKAGGGQQLTEKGYVPDPAQEECSAALECRFEGLTDIFEFSRHMSAEPVARALAREKFTREFRAALAENHQIHYEQSGLVSGVLRLGDAGGGAVREISFDRLSAVRDHSYGKRDWNYMDRHVWLVGFLENGDFFHNSLVRYPAVTELQTGFYKSGGKTVCVKNCSSMDELPLTGGVPPQFSYAVEYEDGRKHQVQCTLDFAVPFLFSKGVYCIHEGVAAFTVNGIRARGMAEFGFNADPSRWTH